MVEEKTVRPEIADFSYLMESVLKENDNKGGWNNCSPSYLLGRLIEEVGELVASMASTNGFAGMLIYNQLITLARYIRSDSHNELGLVFNCPDELLQYGRSQPILEAADVANFAMMIADLAQKDI